MSQRRRKSGSMVVKQGSSKQGTMRTVNAGGVPVPVPQKRENLVKGGLIGGGVTMGLLALTPAGPAAILLGGAAGLLFGGAIGNSVDEEKARR
jgi:hypothetical protein